MFEATPYNLAHKIYKKNHEYKEFQFLILLPQSARNGAKILTNKISSGRQIGGEVVHNGGVLTLRRGAARGALKVVM